MGTDLHESWWKPTSRMVMAEPLRDIGRSVEISGVGLT
jgi:hypothetical protein